MNHEVRFPGIHRRAKALGCTPYHLRCVLTGTRKSEKLAARYWELVNEEKRAKEPSTADEWRALVSKITPEMRAEAAERAAMPGKQHGFFHPGDRIELGKFTGLFPEHSLVEAQLSPFVRREEGVLVCEKPFVVVYMWFPAIEGNAFIVTPKPEAVAAES